MDRIPPDNLYLYGDESLNATARKTFLTFHDFWMPKLPPRTKIEHVGATAVPGCLTRGNLDICVIAMKPDFEAAREKLAATYGAAPDFAATEEFASFVDEDCRPPLSIQLVAREGAMDIFTPFRDLLRQNPALLTAYNNLKRSYSGKPLAAYRTAQDEFITHVLRHGAPPAR